MSVPQLTPAIYSSGIFLCFGLSFFFCPSSFFKWNTSCVTAITWYTFHFQLSLYYYDNSQSEKYQKSIPNENERSKQTHRNKPSKTDGGMTVAKSIHMTCPCVSTFLSLCSYLFPNPCLHGSFPLLSVSLAACSSLSLSPFSVLLSWSATCHSVTPRGQASVSI